MVKGSGEKKGQFVLKMISASQQARSYDFKSEVGAGVPWNSLNNLQGRNWVSKREGL